MTRTNEPLTHQLAHGQYAASELREAENMMSLIAQWDTLPYEMRMTEFDKGTASKFREVPGFEPAWCTECHSEVWLDFRDDPEGACSICKTPQDALDGWAAA